MIPIVILTLVLTLRVCLQPKHTPATAKQTPVQASSKKPPAQEISPVENPLLTPKKPTCVQAGALTPAQTTAYRTHLRQARAFVAKKQMDRAAESIAQALKIWPDGVEALLEQSTLFAEPSQAVAAEHATARAIACGDGSQQAAAWYNRGRWYEQQNNTAQAIAAYENSLRLRKNVYAKDRLLTLRPAALEASPQTATPVKVFANLQTLISTFSKEDYVARVIYNQKLSLGKKTQESVRHVIVQIHSQEQYMLVRNKGAKVEVIPLRETMEEHSRYFDQTEEVDVKEAHLLSWQASTWSKPRKSLLWVTFDHTYGYAPGAYQELKDTEYTKETRSYVLLCNLAQAKDETSCCFPPFAFSFDKEYLVADKPEETGEMTPRFVFPNVLSFQKEPQANVSPLKNLLLPEGEDGTGYEWWGRHSLDALASCHTPLKISEST